jgi:hypothetical protein
MCFYCEEGYGEVSIALTSDNIDVWTPGGVQPEPDTSGYTPYVKSTSAADTAAGTGARKVMVHYLDTDGVAHMGWATMNGVSEVAFTTKDGGGSVITNCMFVQNHHNVMLGSGGVAAGDVDVVAGTSGPVVSRVPEAGNFALSTMRQVPVGHKLAIYGWHASATAGNTKEAVVRVRASQMGGEVFPGVYHFLDTVRLKDSSSGWLPFAVPKIIPALATVKISTWTTGAISVHSTWRGRLERA